MSIKPEQIAEFRRHYNALLNESRHQYSQPIVRELGSQHEPEWDQLELQVEHGLDITIMRTYFHQLVADAEMGREIRLIHNHHPAVARAYQDYLVLLHLTQQS